MIRRLLRRPLALSAAAAIALPLGAGLVAAPASAATPTIRPGTAYACNPATVPVANFSDTSGSPFVAAINCLAGYGFTTGYADGTYRPSLAVTRAEMAVFVYRVGQYAGFTFKTTSYGFTDIGSYPQAFQDAINGLANAGVVSGTSSSPKLYSPGAPVLRGQMAKFLDGLQKALVGAGMPNPGGASYFSDAAAPFTTYINDLAANGVVGGYPDGLYHPEYAVDRQQMALFLTRYVDADVQLGAMASKFPAGNASFPASPKPGTEVAKTEDASGQTTNAVTYSVAVGQAPAVSIALLPASELSRDSSGAVTFSSTAPAKPGSGVSITSVNGDSSKGAAPGSSSEVTQVDGVKPTSSATVSFQVDADTLYDVVPVVWTDTNANKKLDTTSGGYATEPFVAAGQTDFVPAQAANSSTATSVTIPNDPNAVNPRLGYFVGSSGGPVPPASSATYYFTSGDTYEYQGHPATYDQFLGMISAGDVVSVTYENNPTNPPSSPTPSVFNVTTDSVPPASNVVATPSGVDQVTLTWTPSPQTDATYSIYADTGNTGKPSGAPLASGITGDTYTVQTAPQGTYPFLVVAVGGASGNQSTAAASNSVTMPNPAPATLANGALVGVDAVPVGPSSSDQLLFYFNQPMTLGSNPTLNVTDANKNTAVIDSSDATFALNQTAVGLMAPGRILTVTLTATPTTTSGSGSLAYPLTLTSASGLTNGFGQSWNGAGDQSIEYGGPKIIADNVTAATSSFEVMWNKPLSSAGSYTLQSSGALPVPTGTTLNSDKQTVTITVAGSASPGDTLTASNAADQHGNTTSSDTWTLGSAH